MQTSYFAKAKHFEGKRLVSISRSTPDWFQGEWLEYLAPSWNLITLVKQGKMEEYIKGYFSENLNKLNPHYLYRLYKDAILFCYEKAPPKHSTEELYFMPQYFCHRHLVSAWFRKNGLLCEEVYIETI